MSNTHIVDYDTQVAPFPHKLEVRGYDENFDAHECYLPGSSRKYLIDLMVDGTLPDETEESLIGKTVEVDFSHGFVFIGHHPRVVPE